jgi:hypothetical protein
METLIAVLVCLGILVVAALLLAFVLHDSLAECKKALLALALFLGTGCAFVLHFDPSFGIALEVLVGSAFAVVGVFLAPQFSAQDLSKSLAYATGALFAIFKFFGVEDVGVETQVLTFVGLGASTFAIWWTSNAGHRTPLKS